MTHRSFGAGRMGGTGYSMPTPEIIVVRAHGQAPRSEVDAGGPRTVVLDELRCRSGWSRVFQDVGLVGSGGVGMACGRADVGVGNVRVRKELV
jgi:hypothetical protein